MSIVSAARLAWTIFVSSSRRTIPAWKRSSEARSVSASIACYFEHIADRHCAPNVRRQQSHDRQIALGYFTELL
ncbi:hypothetical protein [Bradyrhizobium tropiciagri]|uniref:hypothetical protein n=1 Tax=Bradyrhizobium tropiciagri TaxID=312253 RepID=UPI001009DD52|nr:hypothetical protein [Bradyrhizobium tropiciagri]